MKKLELSSLSPKYTPRNTLKYYKKFFGGRKVIYNYTYMVYPVDFRVISSVFGAR
jgi:hypothetical protein